jgi:hypothetical protein
MSSNVKSRILPPVYVDRTFTNWNGDGDITSSGKSGDIPVDESGWNMVGWNIPRYNERLRNGELLPHTPFWHVKYRHTQDLASEYTRYAAGGQILYESKVYGFEDGEISWKLPYELDDVGSIDLAELDYLVQSAAANIYTKGHDTLTFISELGKVRKMLSGITSRIASLAHGKTLRKSAKLWLEGRYGWRTLVYDLVDLHKAIEEFDSKRSRYSQRVGHTDREVSTSNNIFGSSQLTWTHDIVNIKTVSRRGAVTADIMPPRFRFNPIVTTWEVIPFSFVVDWLLTVGSSLEAMFFSLYSTDEVASAGMKILEEKTVSSRDNEWFNDQYGTYRRDTYSMVETTKRAPTTISHRPQLNVNLDWLKAVDLTALIGLRLR